jgi:uncharacterized RDD family membrane protein YckC
MAGEWHPDPTGRHQYRYWDGARWTDHVADGGVSGFDPLVAPAAEATATAAGAPIASGPPPAWPVGAPMPTAPPAYPPAPRPPESDLPLPPGIKLSSPWVRLGAALLDFLLIMVTLIIGWLIWTLVVWAKGQTPGKQICGLRVVKKDTGHAATWGQMFIRDFLIRALAIGLIGELTFGIFTLVATLMIFSTYHETMWDKWAGTLVVDDRSGVTL